MTENANDLMMTYLNEIELAHLDRNRNGDYTKDGVKHLINAAVQQVKLSRMTMDEQSEQHHMMAERLVLDARDNMIRLGLMEPIQKPQPQPQPQQPAEPPEKVEAEAPAPEEDEGDAREELESLIGLKSAKEIVSSVFNVLKVNPARTGNELPEMTMQWNMVFTGNAGTGKTTVARIVARAFKQMGLLSKGHLCEVDTKDMIAEYVGQTISKTKAIVEKALGGVLFIDEAYALAKNKFGVTEAIPTLLTAMENNRKNLVVIVAGYPENMDEFMRANPGLASRFGYTVKFDDYTADEMLEIFKQMCAKSQHSLTQEAEIMLKDLLAVMPKEFKDKNGRDFGNARGVRNLYEHAVVAQCSRLAEKMDHAQLTKEELCTLEAVDISLAAASMSK